MKVVIPVDEDQKTVCIVFGRTPFFMIYDSETKECHYIRNIAVEEQGGAGIKAAQCVVDADADVLITVRCGENSAEVLKEAGIKIYKSEENLAMDNLEKFEKGTLDELTQFHGGYHGVL